VAEAELEAGREAGVEAQEQHRKPHELPAAQGSHPVVNPRPCGPEQLGDAGREGRLKVRREGPEDPPNFPLRAQRGGSRRGRRAEEVLDHPKPRVAR